MLLYYCYRYFSSKSHKSRARNPRNHNRIALSAGQLQLAYDNIAESAHSTYIDFAVVETICNINIISLLNKNKWKINSNILQCLITARERDFANSDDDKYIKAVMMTLKTIIVTKYQEKVLGNLHVPKR